jgi:hypothetical protein
LRTLLDNPMAFLAFDVGDKTDAARIVFVRGVIKALNPGGGMLRTAH